MTAPNPITEVRVAGLRSLADVRLQLQGLTVLIGDNGAGKSTLLEACELLRRVGTQQSFFHQDFYTVFGGPSSLFRHGTAKVSLGLTIGQASTALHYDVTLVRTGVRVGIAEEKLLDGATGGPVLLRQGPDVTSDSRGWQLDDQTSALQTSSGLQVARMHDALAAIDVHLPFDVTARWGQQLLARQSPMRDGAVLEPATKLSRFGRNLASAFHALKNKSGWAETMTFVRLGLGPDVEAINVHPSPAGGQVGLSVKYSGREEEVPAFALADGMLAYLAFVALFRLDAEPSLVAFDEPDLHLHPDLLIRVLGFFEVMAETRPVLLATQSDRLLDGLSAPEKQVVLCTLDANGATQLAKPDPEALHEWLEDYRGLGDLRATGHMASAFRPREKA